MLGVVKVSIPIHNLNGFPPVYLPEGDVTAVTEGAKPSRTSIPLRKPMYSKLPAWKICEQDARSTISYPCGLDGFGLDNRSLWNLAMGKRVSIPLRKSDGFTQVSLPEGDVTAVTEGAKSPRTSIPLRELDGFGLGNMYTVTQIYKTGFQYPCGN